jgi:hypothetical protein
MTGLGTPDDGEAAVLIVIDHRDESDELAFMLAEAIPNLVDGVQVYIRGERLRAGAAPPFDRLETWVPICDILVLLIGPNWLSDIDRYATLIWGDPMQENIATAIDRHIPIIPILHDGAYWPRFEELPPRLRMLSTYASIEITHATLEHDTRIIKGAIERILSQSQDG